MFSTRSKIRASIVLAVISAGLVVSTHTRWNFLARLEQPVQASSNPPAYTLFESGQVWPLALSPDRTQLFAVNTPDGRLEVFDITPQGPSHRVSIPVGLEPVAVAARTDSEVWVVNHLSDSISIVNVDNDQPNRVVRTLL